jgi:hypothetical protein
MDMVPEIYCKCHSNRTARRTPRLLEWRIQTAFEILEFDADEVFGPVESQEAAKFLKLPYSSFHGIAPSLPCHHVTQAKIVYLRRELLEWLDER